MCQRWKVGVRERRRRRRCGDGERPGGYFVQGVAGGILESRAARPTFTMEGMHDPFCFRTGGVVSSLGKGVAAASIGRILKARGISVVIQKLDPYLNVDPGTMSPYQHGEVYVLEDGTETDLDLGHYERFTDVTLSRNANVTTGQVYAEIITRERRGDFLGGTVQVIPHVTDEIKRRIRALATESRRTW